MTLVSDELGASPPSRGGDAGSDSGAPLFLNSEDKSLSPKERHKARRDAAGRIVADALDKIGNRLLDAADVAVNTGEGNSVELFEQGNEWHRRAYRVRECGTLKTIPYRCPNGHRWEVAPMGCGLRLCPFCERKAAAHVRERLAFLLGGFKNSVRMLTLTMRNRPAGGLATMLDDVVRCFERLRKSPIWRRCVIGAVAVIECTVSEERGWHAHIHVAWDGKFMPWEEVLKAWTKATGGEGTRIDLRGSRWPKAAAVNYLSKYASKGVKVVDLPEGMVGEFVKAWWKFRTLRTYGTLFRMKLPKEHHDGFVRCPECGEIGEPLAWVPSWMQPPANSGSDPPASGPGHSAT